MRPTPSLAAYIGILLAAETAVVFDHPVLGAVCHALLVGASVLLFAVIRLHPTNAVPARPWSAFSAVDLLPVFAQVSILRLLSLAIPVRAISDVYWYAVIVALVLVGLGLTMRTLNLSLYEIGLGRHVDRWQLCIAVSGIPLGLLAYLGFGRQLDMHNDTWLLLIIATLVVIGIGLTEEVLFRGILQCVACGALGVQGVSWTSLVYVVAVMGSRSVWMILVAGLVSWFWGWCAIRTGSIWGIVFAHALMNVGVFIFIPHFA